MKFIHLFIQDLFIHLFIQDCGVRAFCQGCNNKILHVTVVDTSWNLYIFSLPPKFKHRIPHGNSEITIYRVQIFFFLVYFAPLLILFVRAALLAIFPTPKSSRPILDKKRRKTCLLRFFWKEKTWQHSIVLKIISFFKLASSAIFFVFPGYVSILFF